MRRRVNPAFDRHRPCNWPVRQPVAAAGLDRGADLGQAGALVVVAGNGVNRRNFHQVADALL